MSLKVPIGTFKYEFSLTASMETKQVKLTLPKSLYEEGNELVREFGYSNLQDLTLEGLRKEVMELRKQQALVNLKKHFRSVKAKPLTEKQREKIAEEYVKTDTSKIFKEYGLH